jgi:allantoicase
MQPSVSMKGQFGPNGALFDGWESRRHNPTYDWVIVKLGALGQISGVDIDTGCFSGNEVTRLVNLRHSVDRALTLIVVWRSLLRAASGAPTSLREPPSQPTALL